MANYLTVAVVHAIIGLLEQGLGIMAHHRGIDCLAIDRICHRSRDIGLCLG